MRRKIAVKSLPLEGITDSKILNVNTVVEILHKRAKGRPWKGIFKETLPDHKIPIRKKKQKETEEEGEKKERKNKEGAKKERKNKEGVKKERKHKEGVKKQGKKN